LPAPFDGVATILAVVAGVLYSLIRLLLEVATSGQQEHAKLQAEVLVLRRQVQVLERQIKRVQWSPADRMILAALRERIPRTAWAALLVRPETVLGWHRDLVRRKWAAYGRRPRRGRPPLAEDCRELIIRMARENPSWGYFRIRGELIKLGRTVSATAIRSVLRRSGVPPAGRRSELTWKQFLAAHAETLVATDFFSVDTVFLKRLYVLMFVHLGTRRVVAAACTSEPNGEWVTQQARNLAWQLEEEGLELTILLHDRDRKFSTSFDRVFESGGTKVLLTPLMAPKANAHAERWIGSCRRECLDWMLIASEGHLRTVLRQYVDHYNNERPHRSRELRTPSGRGDPIAAGAGHAINRSTRLGGLLSHYHVGARAA
jgi:putative transposase